MSLNNLEVEYICNYLQIPLIACCLQDELKNIKLQNGGYVINYGTVENGGTHYVSVFISGDYAFCFDSFGAPFDSDVLLFIKPIKYKAYNQWIIQDLEDDHCGWYCIGFIFYAYRSAQPSQLFKTVNNFINRFNSDNNLPILKNIFASLIKPQDIPYFNKSIYKKIKK
jgi:hypothetical protein